MPYHVVDWITHHARFTPDKLAVEDLASGRCQTYAQMHVRVGKLAGFLRERGVQKGDRVGFLAYNSTDVLDLCFACWRLGAIGLALNYRLTAPELKFILEDSTPKVVLIDKELCEVAEALTGQTSVAHWITCDGTGAPGEFEDGIAQAEPVLDREPQMLEDQALLMYSSGTTGRPKGVIITHGMLVFSAQSGYAPGRGGRDSTSLAAMPMFHIAGLNVTIMPYIFAGATVRIMRMFEVETVIDAINDPDKGITHFFAVPAAFNAMRLNPASETLDTSRLQTVISGAETVPPPLVKWWGERGVILQEGYGLTETAGQGCLLLPEDVAEKNGSAGKPLINSRMKIVREDGKTALPGEKGEIAISGAVVSPGYWNRPDATAEAFKDGWFLTGDIGYVDQDGFIYIEDRVKDMYISGGENVYPAEIEAVLYGLDAVAEIAVIGVPDVTWGETGCAVAVLRHGANLTLQDITTACEGQLARFKHPQHLTFMEALPRNATGKVQKFKLRETVPSLLGLEG